MYTPPFLGGAHWRLNQFQSNDTKYSTRQWSFFRCSTVFCWFVSPNSLSKIGETITNTWRPPVKQKQIKPMIFFFSWKKWCSVNEIYSSHFTHVLIGGQAKGTRREHTPTVEWSRSDHAHTGHHSRDERDIAHTKGSHAHEFEGGHLHITHTRTVNM